MSKRFTQENRNSQFVVRRRDTQVYSYIIHKPKEPEKKDKTSAAIDAAASLFRFFVFTAAALLTAYLVFLSYPKQNYYFIAWVALVPFLACLKKVKTFLGALFYGWFTGFLVYSFLFYWIYYTSRAGGLNQEMSLLATGALALVIALQFVLFSGLCFYARKIDYLFPLLAAAGWVSIDFLHHALAYNFAGFPWFMMGYSQWNDPLFLQTAGFGGVFAVTFILVFVNACVAVMFTMKTFAERAIMAVMAGAVFCGAFMFGKERLKTEIPFTKEIKVAVLQPDIDQYKKWNNAYVAEIESVLTAQVEEAAAYDPDIIVWPETALPGPAHSEKYMSWLSRISENKRAYQLVGSTLAAEDKNFVSAYLFNKKGELESLYHKEILVPFGEYIPFEDKLGNLDIEVLGALGSFTPGGREQALQEIDGVKTGTAICYESIFPFLWSGQARNGAKIFFNITNDGWYLDTAAPYQHFAANALRAVETGRPLVRSANTGISGWIDARGRIKDSSVLGARTVMTFAVPVDEDAPETFYTKYGNLFAYVCIIIFLTISCTAFVISDE